MEKLREQFEKIFVLASFGFFILMACYKLTYAPLWYDETIEYWYSKIMFGILPYEINQTNATINMYQRIISTYQPPLYNFIMFFWLKISDAAWWFRFFGVFMGFMSMVAIYKTTKKISNNSFLASWAVIFSSCNFRLLYYWQECAEYCLMLGTLCWTVYFWICLIQDINKKNIVLFTFFSIASVYSQYGAVFPVLGMCLIAYIVILLKKNKNHIIQISIAYLEGLIAALLLYILFLKEQLLQQQGGSIAVHSLKNAGFIKDFLRSLYLVFEYNFTSNLNYYYSYTAVCIIIAIIAIITVIVVIKGSFLTKLIFLMNAITWITYYTTVKLELYSHASYSSGFANRYNLFFVPLWIIFLFVIGNEFYSIIKDIKILESYNVHKIFSGILFSLIVIYGLLSWNLQLRNNWEKADIRSTVDAWYQQAATESNTIVFYKANSLFSYYIRQNEQYNYQTEKNVIYMVSYDNKNEESFINFVNSIYGENWPEEIYLIGTITDEFNIFLKVFTDNNYIPEEIDTSNYYLLVKLISS